MQKKNPTHELVLKNERAWTFYNSHTSINFETANLLLIDFLEAMFNKISSSDTNINSQILSFMQEHSSEIQSIKSSISTLQDNIHNNTLDVSTKLSALKKEYLEDIALIVNNNILNSNEKMSSILDKNTELIYSKTSLLFNDIIPKNNDKLHQEIQQNLKSLYDNLAQETQLLAKTNSGEKSLNEFITSFETKYASTMQSIQQPLYACLTSSEGRISTNIEQFKESFAAYAQPQSKIFEDLGDFLSKYSVSSNKGKYGEQNLHSILNSLFQSSDIRNTTGQKSSGDFIMKRLEKPTIMFENKDYKYNIDKDEISKFITDVVNQNMHGIFLSQYSGIAFKQNYQIDINKGNILVYVQNCEYSPDKIKIAVDIIDSLSVKVAELNADGDENTISSEMLDDINQEYQSFIAQKEALLGTLKDFNKKLTTQIDDIKLPVLDKYLAPKYAFVKTRVFTCDLCNNFTTSGKQSLSAHKRGCKKRHSDTIDIDTA
jgi:hypothetical protein